MPSHYNTDSLDPPIPPSLRQALGLGPPERPVGIVPSYQQGGQIGPGGVPMDPVAAAMPAGLAAPGSAGTVMPPEAAASLYTDIESASNQAAAQAPEQMAELRAMLMEGIQSGELTEQELNMMIQLATLAGQNPAMYPRIRAFAIQQGIATEEDLPQEYDPTLVLGLLTAAKSIQGGGEMVPASPISMGSGGMVPASSVPGGSVLINAHEGEFVIPTNVVAKKGTDFFDKLIESANPTDGK